MGRLGAAGSRMTPNGGVVVDLDPATRKKHGPLNERAYIGEAKGVDAPDPPEERLRAYIDRESDPHDVLSARNDFADLVDFAQGDLSRLEQEVMGLWLSDFSYVAIAERTGYSEKTIDNAMQRVRRKASERLEMAA
jgi:RNA polymerase sporulation-specific sigma factor